jgi:hypothetical protein
MAGRWRRIAHEEAYCRKKDDRKSTLHWRLPRNAVNQLNRYNRTQLLIRATVAPGWCAPQQPLIQHHVVQ